MKGIRRLRLDNAVANEVLYKQTLHAARWYLSHKAHHGTRGLLPRYDSEPPNDSLVYALVLQHYNYHPNLSSRVSWSDFVQCGSTQYMDHFKMQCIQGPSTLYLVKDAVMALAIPCIYESNILYGHLMHSFLES